MVYETRKVVEDYVLYKIKNYITSSQRGDSNIDGGAHPGADMQNFPHFPQPQDPPSNINRTVRALGHDYEELYRSRFPDLLGQVRAHHFATLDVDKVFTIITKELFVIKYRNNNGASASSGTASPLGGRKSRTPSPALHDSDRSESRFTIDDSNVKWGHIMGLLVFTGDLAVRCVEINRNGQVDEIVNWVTKFLDTKLGGWLTRHGGWDGLVTWHSQSRGSRSLEGHTGSHITSALRITGAVAAVALGAFVITRK